MRSVILIFYINDLKKKKSMFYETNFNHILFLLHCMLNRMYIYNVDHTLFKNSHYVSGQKRVYYRVITTSTRKPLLAETITSFMISLDH